MQGNEVHIKSQADWDTHVLKSEKPVIVDFWAEWCPPCRKLKPQLEEAAKNGAGKWVLACVNVDEQGVNALAGKYATQGIPSVYLFKGGQQVDHFLGCNEGKAKAMIATASQ